MSFSGLRGTGGTGRFEAGVAVKAGLSSNKSSIGAFGFGCGCGC